MKILLSWLNEYGDFGDPADADAVQRVADALTSLGLEVDAVESIGETVGGVVTARILRLESHPDAAKVQRVYVDAVDRNPVVPSAEGIVPPLLPQVRPPHQVIEADALLPGCPPPAARIRDALEALLAGRMPPSTGEAIRFR